MTGFDEAFAAWLAFHAAIGVDQTLWLASPATEKALDAAEARIGFDLPADVRALYRRADGQRDPYLRPDIEAR